MQKIVGKRVYKLNYNNNKYINSMIDYKQKPEATFSRISLSLSVELTKLPGGPESEAQIPVNLAIVISMTMTNEPSN